MEPGRERERKIMHCSMGVSLRATNHGSKWTKQLYTRTFARRHGRNSYVQPMQRFSRKIREDAGVAQLRWQQDPALIIPMASAEPSWFMWCGKGFWGVKRWCFEMLFGRCCRQ